MSRGSKSIQDYVNLLRFCGSVKDGFKGKELHAEIQQSPHSRSAFLLNALIQMYGKCGLVEEARSVFKEIQEPRFHSWSLILTAYAQNGFIREAEAVFELIDKRNPVPWTIMINAYGTTGNIDAALILFDQMPFQDVVSETAMLVAYAQNGHMDRAKSVFDSMATRNVVTWTAMMDGLAQFSYEKALDLFHKMPRRNTVSWNAMFTANAENGHLLRARECFDQMPERNIVSWNALIGTFFSLEEDSQHGKLVFDRMPQRDSFSWNIALKSYAQNGQLDEAREVLKTSPTESTLSWTTLISAAVNQSSKELASELFHSMCLRGLKPDETTFQALLNSCNTWEDCGAKFSTMSSEFDLNPTAEHYSFMVELLERDGRVLESEELIQNVSYSTQDFLWIMALLKHFGNVKDCTRGRLLHSEISSSSSLSTNVVLANFLIVMYGRCGSIREAREVFESITHRTTVSWNVMITAYAQNNHLEEALSMLELAAPRDPIAWTPVIQACGEAGRAEEAWSLFRRIPEPDPVSETAMLVVFTQNHYMQEARGMFDVMKNRGVVAWTAMLAGYSQTRDSSAAAEVFQRMPQRSVVSWTAMLTTRIRETSECKELFDSMPERDSASWSAFVGGLAEQGELKLAMEAYIRMPNQDSIACNTLLNALGERGELERLRETFEGMLCRDVVTWSVMVSANAHTLDAIGFYHRMCLEGFGPNEFTFTGVLNACSHIGLLDESRAQMVSMVGDHGVEPDMEHYSVMVDILTRCGQLNQALELIRSMPFVPHDVTWKSLLGASKTHNDQARGLEAAEVMLGMNVDDASAYAALTGIL